VPPGAPSQWCQSAGAAAPARSRSSGGPALPFAVLRKAVLRSLHRSLAFQRKGAGTFQVSIVPGVDQFVTPVFGGSAVLTAGRVAERVVAVKGVPLVRPTVHLACSADHRVWNGSAAERFLRSLKGILEGPELGKEALNS